MAAGSVRRDDAQQGAAFTTPSGNITCWLERAKTDDGDPEAGCSIDARSWSAPPSDCQLAYGGLIAVTGDEAARFLCIGDIPSCFVPTLDQPNACHGPSGLWWHRTGDPTRGTGQSAVAVLSYGTSVRIGPVECTSASSGVSCENHDTGRGFTLSRERYTLTPAT
ncbi:hypothetical protein D9V37_01655 [Nocardioides mangrovicus]|uniref:Uncharacterized protein n=1 Tax=Nocardioides mangrovicus TaxID=2478913 RepID=A0A3L8P7V5_9ACTN|nr:hypothetical protein D9V37_01655 [Nocardioides mangrovicus]